MDRASQTYPYCTRLFVDVDPAGNPVGRGAIRYERGSETATLWFQVPGPFDHLIDAVTDLLDEFGKYSGVQLELF